MRGARALLGGVAATLVLAACGAADDANRPDEMTVGESRALREAAEMLDEQRLPADTQPVHGEDASAGEADPKPDGIR